MVDQTVTLGWLKLFSAHPKTAVFRCHSEESRIWRDDEESHGQSGHQRFFAELVLSLPKGSE